MASDQNIRLAELYSRLILANSEESKEIIKEVLAVIREGGDPDSDTRIATIHDPTSCRECSDKRSLLEMSHPLYSSGLEHHYVTLAVCGYSVACPKCVEDGAHDVDTCPCCAGARVALAGLHDREHVRPGSVSYAKAACGWPAKCPKCVESPTPKTKGDPKTMDEHKYCFFSRSDLTCTESFHEQPHKIQLQKKIRRLRTILQSHMDAAFAPAGEVNEQKEACDAVALLMYKRSLDTFKAMFPALANPEHGEMAKMFEDQMNSAGTVGVAIVSRGILGYTRFGETYAAIPRIQAEVRFARLLLLEIEAINPGLLAHAGLAKPIYGLLDKSATTARKPSVKKIKIPFVPTSDWERPNLLVKAIFGEDVEGNNNVTVTSAADVQA